MRNIDLTLSVYVAQTASSTSSVPVAKGLTPATCTAHAHYPPATPPLPALMQSASRLTSEVHGDAAPLSSRTSAVTRSAAAASLSTQTTCKPSAARRFGVALTIPRPAPAATATSTLTHLDLRLRRALLDFHSSLNR